MLMAALIGGSFVPAELSAKQLSTRELRRSGFTGAYRGVVSGQGQIFNLGTGTFNAPYAISTNITEPVPARRSVQVLGPTNASSFALTSQPATGNDRRVRIIARYSGASADTFFGAVMVGSGAKTLTITKRGEGRNARFTMRYSNNLDVRRQSGNVLRAFWRIGGTLTK